MDPIHGYPYHWISVVRSAASVQKELAERSGQCNSSITGSWITVDTVQFRDTKQVDSIDRIYCSIPTDVFCYVCNIQTSFMVGNTSEMSTKVKKDLPVPSTKVARS